MKRSSLPSALTIAGSDSGGGAGIQADLKTFAAHGIHGTTAITCLTAQNPRGVLGVQAATPETVRLQLQAIFDELPPAAIKTGMLYSGSVIRVVAEFLKSVKNRPPLVVDPVMVATSGARLLKPAAVALLKDKLLPLCTLMTPNLDEAALLTNRQLRTPEDLRWAARELHGKFGCAALVKGGHLQGIREAIDILYDGEQELMFTAEFVRGVSTHGTGCTYSAAITANLALGHSLEHAVELGKDFISSAIVSSQRVARHTVLGVLPAGDTQRAKRKRDQRPECGCRCRRA